MTIELKAILGGVDNPDFGLYSSIFGIRTIFIFQKKTICNFPFKRKSSMLELSMPSATFIHFTRTQDGNYFVHCYRAQNAECY